MELDQLAQALVVLGRPAEKSAAMAAQLDKRARQLAATKGRTYEEALAHRQIARLLPAGDRSRDGELSKARDLFSRLAAKYDLGAIDTSSPETA